MAFHIDVQPAAYVQLDLFPASVVRDGESLGEELRVVVTDNHFYVFTDAVEGPYALIGLPLISFDGNNKDGYTIETAETTFAVKRAQNCGCGSRLRGIRPFAGIPYITQINIKG